jgi:2,3-bisphosphoglycerate-independent phosphoglycerate mutase
MNQPKPVVLLILDGWGVSSGQTGDAIDAASTPTWDLLMSNAPHITLSGSGEDVGLPVGQMGNSEVGHLTIGSGRVIDQDLSRISKSIQQGDFFQNSVLKENFQALHNSQKTLHIFGLLSPGGVHSHEDHLLACIKMACDANLSNIVLHLFLDGRDTPPQSAMPSLKKLEQYIAPLNNVHIGSITGRYYAMDRDKRWDRVKKAYDAIVYGKSQYTAQNATEALEAAYARGETDEFVSPTCLLHHHQLYKMQNRDSVVYMNFRSDRARALTYALTDPNFSGFDKGEHPPVLQSYITLTEYDPTLPVKVAFPPQSHQNVLGEYLQNKGLTQLHLAETEKYAHVTFFFNGGIETPYKGETRILIPSPKVATYDLCPEMGAEAVTDALVTSIKEKKYDFIVCNYANADMVGHTGSFEATVEAIEVLDRCLSKIVQALHEVNAEALITADHGNAECMLDEENDQPHTAHTLSLVPLVYVGNRRVSFTKSSGTLSDVAPTLLTLMDLAIPTEMTGENLIKVKT